jgi:hypothetical protein
VSASSAELFHAKAGLDESAAAARERLGRNRKIRVT